MTKKHLMVCEARLAVEAQNGNETPTGKIEARVTTWGKREGADGRRFWYQPEGFMDWAKEFQAGGRPLPMFVNHSADEIPVGEWTSFEFDDEGMTASGRLYMNTSKGQDLYLQYHTVAFLSGATDCDEVYTWSDETLPVGAESIIKASGFKLRFVKEM